MTKRRAFYRWDLTPHERMALASVLTDYIGRPDATEVSIDAATGAEIEIGSLLGKLLQLDPTIVEEDDEAAEPPAAKIATRDDVKDVYAEGLALGIELGRKLPKEEG